MIRKIGITVGTCLSVIFLLFVVKAVQLLRAPLPNPAPLQEVWLPKDAEIRLNQEVHPGTFFYILLSVAEFRHRFPIGGDVIVSFPSNPTMLNSTNSTIEMWKPGGNGLFWKTRQTIIQPWKQGLVGMIVKLEGGKLIAYPERELAFGIFMIAFSAIIATACAIGTASAYSKGPH